MARIRSGKPEFWTDPKMVALPRDVRFTFKGIWEVSADDWGRFQADPRLIKGQVWPLDDDITLRKLASYIERLAECGVIILYEHDGIRYGFIRNWFRHQRIDHPTDSLLPLPPAPYARLSHETYAKRSRKPREPLAVERSGADGSGEEEERSGAEARAPDSIPPDPDPMNLEPVPAPPAPRLGNLPWARRFLDTFYDPHLNSTENRRMDAGRQLYDTVDPARPAGARLHKGEYVKARSPEHLEACCRELVEDPGRIRESSKAIVVLLKMLKDPPKGPTVTELAKRDDAERVAVEEAYQRAAKRAGLEWARGHPAEYEEIRKPIDAQFATAAGDIGSMAREAVLIQATARAAGFPTYDVWIRGQNGNGAHP